MTEVGAGTRAELRPLVIRESDDDPETFVVGRPEAGTFAELPKVGVEAVTLLAAGLTVLDVEQRLADGADRPDVAALLDDLVDLGWVAALDGQPLPDPAPTARVQLRWLRPVWVRWLFSWPAVLCVTALALSAAVTVARQPSLLPTYRDFFWTDYVGLATFGNILLVVCGGLIHESMHFAAAHSLGLPARIGLGTRLNNLALQTDVSSAWAVPRRQRYRVYLAGMAWDVAAISVALLLSAYIDLAPTVRAVFAAYTLIAMVSVALQANVYMRTDLYFVLMDALRCGDLFHDGLRYARYLVVRVGRAVRGRSAPANPVDEIPAKEARAVRIYGPLAVLGSAGALAVYALFGVPVLVHTVARASAALAGAGSGESVLRLVDSGLILLVESGLLLAFLVTFHRTHAGWFRWIPSPSGRR